MKSAKTKPIYVTPGAIKIKVLRNGPARFCIAWRAHIGAPRTRETFTKKAKAIERADAIAQAIANGQSDVLTLTSADRDGYRTALAALAPLDIPLHAAIHEYLAARKLIGQHTLIEAATFYAREKIARAACPPTGKIAAELLSSKTNRRHRAISAKTTPTIRARVNAAANAFPDLTKPSEHDLLVYLEGLTVRSRKKIPDGKPPRPVAAKTRDHHLAAILELYTYAQRRGWLPAGAHAASNISKVWQAGAVATYSPAELRAMFKACKPEWIPLLAIAAFAGLRTTEIYRLRWEHFRWQPNEEQKTRGYIAIPIHVAAKTLSPRPAPILPALELWLANYRQDFGALYPYDSLTDFEHAMQHHLTRYLESRVPGFDWKYNALRHSFVSYRLAQVQNKQQVRVEAGHTEQMQSRYYNEPKTPEESAAYFAILPPPKESRLHIVSAAGA